ncbi:keratinocyte differentiation-associated protein isoform X3 [Heterocephalus glaber]|uniref:Keratinocyte differentiation-associated protein isoform X3 n=1 Tax=Heterocephalus glaber TaxID=10181 RepID=A0AAX6RHC7_HETGA|nr:keratinocyte differentiation-associated protein isoform X3 [Heterocephalus glaber]
MKIPVLPAVALLSLLVLHSAQGAALGSPEEEATIANYALGSEAFNNQFLNIGKWKNNFNTDEFLNWHALIELKGMRSAVPDSQ